MRLTDDPCVVVGAQGNGRVDRKTMAKMMQSASYELKAYELSHVDVRMVGADVAIVAYQVREDLIVEGKPVTLKAADASTWVRREGGWLCALHTESILGDPFGRDRQAPTSHREARE